MAVWPHITVNPTILQSPVFSVRIMFILKATEQPGNFMCIREFSDRDYSDLDRNVYGVTRCVY